VVWGVGLVSLAVLHHDDVVAKLRLDRRIRVVRRAAGGRLELEGGILEGANHSSSSLPPKAPYLQKKERMKQEKPAGGSAG